MISARSKGRVLLRCSVTIIASPLALLPLLPPAKAV